MGIFSEESNLLINNWEAVKSIISAKKHLEKELQDFLFSVESDLKKTEWWNRDWFFDKHTSTQVYISKQNWKVGTQFALWIGIEGFTSESIFGYESQALLYVWVEGKRNDLVAALINKLSEKEEGIIGEIDYGSNGFVIRQVVSQYLPDETGNFKELLKRQILQFFSHYAVLLNEYDKFVENSLRNDL